MSEPAHELEADQLAVAADNARRGVVSHLTIHGERVAVIVPDSVIEALSVLATAINSERVAGDMPTLLLKAMPWSRSLPKDDLPTLATELAEAAASGRDAPERVATLIREWRATADIYADPSLLAALTTPIDDHGPVPEPAG